MNRITDPPALPNRPADGHKGTFGRVLVVAGSRGMTGAAVLSGIGALRGGAGLVYVAAPASVVPIIAAHEPSYLTLPLPENGQQRLGRRASRRVLDRAASMDATAVGPGLGKSRGVTATVLALYRDLARPLVVDADALNALARAQIPLQEHAGPRILTPHPGEFSRLTGVSIDEIARGREQLAGEFALRHGVVVLLKGAGTVVTDGENVFINNTGNSGMATGGTGDVLTGLLVALLAQGMSPFDAARLGAWVHGRAGDLAAAELSQPAFIASDLPRYLGRVWRELGDAADA